jgi:DNA-binding response OmpR family regulator
VRSRTRIPPAREREVSVPGQHSILVVDDDPKTIEIIRLRLERDGYLVSSAADGQIALEKIRGESPDLVVLDLMLPRIEGFDLCHIVRSEYGLAVPIIMLSARSTEDDKLTGLELGADDYLTKPFSPRELSARVSAVLRRTVSNVPAQSSQLSYRGLTVDPKRFEATLNGNPIRLTPTELTLLATLMAEPQRAFTRSQLLDTVFGYAYDGLERTIDVHINNLRKKIETNPSQPEYVITVYGVGYRFAGEEEPHGRLP